MRLSDSVENCGNLKHAECIVIRQGQISERPKAILFDPSSAIRAKKMGFELVIHTLIFTHTTTFVLNICIVKHIAYKTRVESRDASRRTTTSSWNMSWNGMEMMCTGFSRRKTTSGGMWVGQRAYTEQLVDCERVRRRGEYASDCRCNGDKKSNQRRGDRKTGRRRKRGSLQSSEWCGGIGFLLDYVR